MKPHVSLFALLFLQRAAFALPMPWEMGIDIPYFSLRSRRVSFASDLRIVPNPYQDDIDSADRNAVLGLAERAERRVWD